MLWLLSGAPHLHAAKGNDVPSPGFVTEFAAPLDDVLQALQEVLQDQTIHGTYMFDKDPTLTGAKVAESTPLFEPWKCRRQGLLQDSHRCDRSAPFPRKRRPGHDCGSLCGYAA